MQMLQITNFYVFLTALLGSLLLIPPISKLAVGMGILDRPDERKRHEHEIPRLGGIAIFFAFLLTIIFFARFTPTLRGYLAGAIIIFLTGLADDLTGLSPVKKLFGQSLAAFCAVVIGGLQLKTLGTFGSGSMDLAPFIAVPFTMFAMVGLTNAINLLDGLDGLAGGVSAIAAGALGILAYLSGNTDLLLLCLALIGTVIGFLKYNTHPATIFMGDAGSLLLGYSLAFFSTVAVTEGHGVISPLSPLIVLALPVLDTAYVFVTRMRRGKSPFSPDRTHIHHRLMELGFSHRVTVVIIYAFSYFFAAFAVTCYRMTDFELAAAMVILSGFFYTGCWLAGMSKIPISTFLQNWREQEGRAGAEKAAGIPSWRTVALKYLSICILLLPVLLPSTHNVNVAVMAGLLFSLCLLLLLIHPEDDRFLLFVLYFTGVFIVYQIENYGRSVSFSGVSLLSVSTILFLLLFLVVVVKIFLHRNNEKLTGSPLEYLLLCVVLSVPLLPDDFTARYHLLTVTGKSVILFMAYKLVLMRDALRNRKIIFATVVALLVILLRSLA